MLSLEQLLAEFTPAAPAGAQALADLQKVANVSLPEAYRDFLAAANGGHGFVGDNHVVLWSVDQLEEFNRGYEVETYAPGFFLIGSNGGGEAYAIDLDTGSVVMVPFIGMDRREAFLVSPSFSGFFHDLYEFDLSNAAYYERR